MNSRKLSQAGDTIVEVLIAIMVMSIVLGGAYVSANRSLNNSRQAQERAEALKVGQSQLEKLKSLAASSPSTVFDTSILYCINSAGAKKPAADPSCVYPPRYKVTVKDGPIPDDFTVTVTWDSLRGGKDQIVMNYRLHP